MRNYRSFIEGFLEYTKHVESPEKFLLWSALSCISGALERKTWIVFNGTQFVYPNQYIMIVGPSGLAKKSSGTGVALSILKEAKGINFMSTQVTAASLVKQLGDAGADKAFNYDGKEYRNSSLYLYSSEASATLSELQGGGSIVELLTDFYDCNNSGSSEWSTTSSWSKETIGGGKVRVFNPCLNMLACSTPEWLLKTVGKDEIRGGFASRILFVVHHGKAERSVGWLEDSELNGVNASAKQKLIQDLNQIAQLKGRFKISPDFGAVFNQEKLKIDNWLLANQSHEMKSYYARKLWHAMKLCQVLSADTSNDLTITGLHLEYAIKLLEEIEPNMLDAFGVVGENPKVQSLYKIWDIMKNRGSITRRELLRLAHKQVDTKGLDEHIRTLLDMQKIVQDYRAGTFHYTIIDGSDLK